MPKAEGECVAVSRRYAREPPSAFGISPRQAGGEGIRTDISLCRAGGAGIRIGISLCRAGGAGIRIGISLCRAGESNSEDS